MKLDYAAILSTAEKGVQHYLDVTLEQGKIDQQSFELAKQNTIKNLNQWLFDPNIDSISPHCKMGIAIAVEQERWQDIVNAFRKKMNFGTGGIRGLMASDRVSILQLKKEGIDAPILKGPNTLNNIVLLQTSAGVAKFGRDKNFSKIVIGYDSRVRGYDFAHVITELFLAYGFQVFLFDAPCPYPEVTFAIPYREIHSHMGILISASHNDYRYNGYKLSCGNGSQFDPEQRSEMYDKYILNATTSDIKLLPLKDAPRGQLIFLGGEKAVDGFDYCGHQELIIDVHKAHQTHVKSFLLQGNEIEKKLKIGYCAFHGAGRIAVPRLLNEIGFEQLNIITRNGLYELDGLFPSFNSEPGKEQQPDPGDPRAANVAVAAYKQEFPGQFESTDIVIGTDPDADRCGIVVKVPENQRFLFKDREYSLMPADEMWALLLWYRLQFDRTLDREKAFIVLSHITTDCIVKLALKNNLGVVKTWVGFANLSAAVRDAWNKKLVNDLYEGRKDPQDALCNPFIQETMLMDTGKRSYNIAAMEQSNGFSLLGFPPPDESSLGEKGHVRDKDGTFAAVLMAEVADWAKRNGTNLYELLDNHIYLDPDIGLFVNYYEPDPLDGEYPGIEGDNLKKKILQASLDLYRKAQNGLVEIAGRKVLSTVLYRTGKYDSIYQPSLDFIFPDEGVRFYFDQERLNHLTVRPSGTTNSLRFHVQLHSPVTEHNLIDRKRELHAAVRRICDDIRKLTKAPRSSEIE
jgi:phosphoglucomutase